jgi:hypothetical protein
VRDSESSPHFAKVAKDGHPRYCELQKNGKGGGLRIELGDMPPNL